MDAPTRRLLAEALSGAAGALEREFDYGEYRWTGDDGSRCYSRKDEDGFTLTIAREGEPPFVIQFAGVDGSHLS